MIFNTQIVKKAASSNNAIQLIVTCNKTGSTASRTAYFYTNGNAELSTITGTDVQFVKVTASSQSISMYTAANKHVTIIGDVPDGDYRFQVAKGNSAAAGISGALYVTVTDGVATVTGGTLYCYMAESSGTFVPYIRSVLYTAPS